MMKREILTVCYLIVVTCLLLTGCTVEAQVMELGIRIAVIAVLTLPLVVYGGMDLWRLFQMSRTLKARPTMERGNSVFKIPQQRMLAGLPPVTLGELLMRNRVKWADEAPVVGAAPASRVP